MSNGRERRAYPRLPLEMVVQFRLHDLNEFMRDYAANLSQGGMFIRTREPRAEGSLLYVQFRLKDGASLIEGLARVVHVNGPDQPIPGMGLEFVNLDAKSVELIDRIVTERLPDNAP